MCVLAHESAGLPPVAALDSTSILLAEEIRKSLKSPGDEVIDTIFFNFPTAFAGLVLGYFLVEYAKKTQERLDTAALNIVLEDYFTFIAVPGFCLLFVLAANFGVLGGASGLFAKALLDGWNVFANLLLPGAILKY